MDKKEFITKAKAAGAPEWFIEEAIADHEQAQAEGINIPYELVPLDFPED